MDILLNVVVLFGLLAVGLAFVLLLPAVGQILVSVFTTVVTEQTIARFRGQESGTTLTTPSTPIATEAPDQDDHAPTPIWVYVTVYLSLVVLTGVTVGVSELGLPMKQSIFWAVTVASLKATLVVAWFMHVRGGPAINRLILGTTFFFVGVFFTLTMADLSTRAWISEEEGHLIPMEEAQDNGRTPSGWSSKTNQQQ